MTDEPREASAKSGEDHRQSEERFRLLVESVSDYAIYMLDTDGLVQSWNPGAERLKSYTEKEIVGKPYRQFFLPDDVKAGKPETLLRMARELGHVEDEGWRVRKDGTRFWASAVITAMHDEHGQFVGYAKVTRDLSERKRAEDERRQFELLVKSVTDYAIIMLDPEGRITSWNRGAEALKGYREDEILGLPNRTFYTPEDVAAGRPEMLLATAAREGHVEDEGWRVRKDGTRFWADVVLTAMRQDDRLVGFAKITRDLTERKQVEELAAKTARLQASNQLKSQFLATMSHELRTPLNSIIGYTELVLTDDAHPIGETGESNLGIVLRNARHLLTLISEILDLSKIEAGQTTVHPEPFDPYQTLLTVVSSTRALAEQKGLSLTLLAEPGLDLVVSDETKVRQIVINLVSNAVKFTEKGAITIRLAASGKDAWTVEVTDTGIGISPEHQEMVFQEFRQVDSSTTRAQGGTGLGLAISRRLAELLEGRLVLESEVGRGSRFTLELPRQLAGRFMPQPVRPAAHPTQPLSAPGGDRPVLLAIDDDPEALHLLAERLKGSPYEVVTASSGESGLDLARELHPAVITLDVLMPQMDGWMTLRQLRQSPETADVPVVLLTFLENRGLAARLGVTEYLTKPFETRSLLETLERAVGPGPAREPA